MNFNKNKTHRLAFYFNNKYEDNPAYLTNKKRFFILSKFIDELEKEN